MAREADILATPHRPSAASLKALGKLGNDLREARLRRRLPMSLVAERAFTSRSTLQRVERGDHRVGIGIHAAVLRTLGLVERLAEVADPRHDVTGRILDSAALPKRARPRRGG